MKTIIFIILCLFLFNCQKEKSKSNKTKNINKNDTVTIQKDTIELESDHENKISDSVYLIKKENRESFFSLYYSKNKNKCISIDSLIIRNKTNNKNQKIRFKKDFYLLAYYELDFSVDKDINFDGFKDIELTNYQGLYNSSYSYWAYKKKLKKYKHIKSLDSLYNPGFDSIKKEVNSGYRIALSSFHKEIYFWRNDEIILKYEEVKYFGLDSEEHLYTKKLVNGKYVETGDNPRE